MKNQFYRSISSISKHNVPAYSRLYVPSTCCIHLYNLLHRTSKFSSQQKKNHNTNILYYYYYFISYRYRNIINYCSSSVFLWWIFGLDRKIVIDDVCLMFLFNNLLFVNIGTSNHFLSLIT